MDALFLSPAVLAIAVDGPLLSLIVEVGAADRLLPSTFVEVVAVDEPLL